MTHQFKKVLPIFVFLFIGKGIYGLELTGSDENLEEEQHLSLSKHELHALTSALFETATHPCPSVDLNVISNIKNFIVGRILLGAPRLLSKQNEAFGDNYWKFVGCLESQAMTNPKAQTGIQRLKETHPNIRSKRDVDGLTDGLTLELDGDNLILNPDALLEEELAVLDAKKSFQYFFNLMSSIAGHDCPLGKRPSSTFVQSAVEEIVYWLSIEPDLLKTAQEKYFHHSNILEDLHRCEKTLEKKREKISRTKSYAA